MRNCGVRRPSVAQLEWLALRSLRRVGKTYSDGRPVGRGLSISLMGGRNAVPPYMALPTSPRAGAGEALLDLGSAFGIERFSRRASFYRPPRRAGVLRRPTHLRNGAVCQLWEFLLESAWGVGLGRRL